MRVGVVNKNTPNALANVLAVFGDAGINILQQVKVARRPRTTSSTWPTTPPWTGPRCSAPSPPRRTSSRRHPREAPSAATAANTPDRGCEEGEGEERRGRQQP